MPAMMLHERTAAPAAHSVRPVSSTRKNLAGGGASTEACALAERDRLRIYRSQRNSGLTQRSAWGAAAWTNAMPVRRAPRACFVVQVRPGHERAMARRIERVAPARVEALAPERVLPFRDHGAWSTRTDVLFPGYVLVFAEHPDDVADALALIAGFAQPLGMDAGPLALDAAQTQFIEALCAQGPVVGVSRGRIVDGVLVVDEGPLRGLEHLVAKIDRHKRVAYLDVHVAGQSDTDVCEGASAAARALSGDGRGRAKAPARPRVGLEVVSKT